MFVLDVNTNVLDHNTIYGHELQTAYRQLIHINITENDAMDGFYANSYLVANI